MICIHVKSLPNLAFIIPLHPKKKNRPQRQATLLATLGGHHIVRCKLAIEVTFMKLQPFKIEENHGKTIGNTIGKP